MFTWSLQAPELAVLTEGRSRYQLQLLGKFGGGGGGGGRCLHTGCTCTDQLECLQDFYEHRPAKALSDSPMEFARSAKQQSTGKLYRDTHTIGKTEDGYAGRAGRRGELVRHPGEAGSVYGVSTFVDDYARWGTKLQGLEYGQLAAQATTRYFDA